jgi:shikimate dehydrogenase
MKIDGSTPLFALLGNPARHSMSPTLHNGWIEEFGFKGVYVALEMDPLHFEASLDGLFHAGLQGANVTFPFKERAYAHAQSTSSRASAIASVNCLSRLETGFLGDTTDGDGFIADLDARAPGWRQIEGHVVILGAGGAARALLDALSRAGKDGMHLVNRNLQRAQQTAAIVASKSITVQPWDNLANSLEGAGLVINATSAGLNGQSPLAPDFSQTHGDCLVYDTVYSPRETAFLTAARADRRQAVDGLGMLAGQGALAFETWFGVRPDLLSGLKRLEKALAP